MPTLMPHPLAYVFKRELLHIPFFGWAMARLDMIHIDRSKRAAGLEQGGRAGQAAAGAGHLGHHVPRGHAHRRAARQGIYKSGGTRLAVATGAPVMPIAVTSAQVLAAQGFHQASRRGRRLDRQADPAARAASPTS